MTDAPLGNLDFDDVLRFVESGTSKSGSLKFLSPRKSDLSNSATPIVHNYKEQSKMQPKAQKRQSKKGRTSAYESDDDTQIAIRLARLRRDVLEHQQEVEAEEVVNEHEHTHDALERLRSFRESLGIPEPQQRQQQQQQALTPKTKAMSKRRYSAGDKSLRKDFESPAEVSEAQLLYRLQKLRQSLTSPERGSRGAKSQRATKKKRIQYFPSNTSSAAVTDSQLPPTTSTSMSAELFSATTETPQATQDAANMLHLQGVNPGLAKELQQHWAMDLNNVMQMGFAIEGAGQVDQFVGPGHMHQYAQ